MVKKESPFKGKIQTGSPNINVNAINTGSPSVKNIFSGNPKNSCLFNFSLRYWQQIENFGLDKRDQKWFISVLDRLKSLSSLFVEELFRGSAEGLRFHGINWKSSCLKPKDIKKWVPAEYIDKQEYGLYQIAVSQGEGRIIGFFDENHIFHIVLLDPEHNMQLCKRKHYKVTPCSPEINQYADLLTRIDELKQITCPSGDCPAVKAVDNIMNETVSNKVFHSIDEETMTKVQKWRDEGYIDDLKDLIFYGLDFLEIEQNKDSKLTH